MIAHEYFFPFLSFLVGLGFLLIAFKNLSEGFENFFEFWLVRLVRNFHINSLSSIVIGFLISFFVQSYRKMINMSFSYLASNSLNLKQSLLIIHTAGLSMAWVPFLFVFNFSEHFLLFLAFGLFPMLLSNRQLLSSLDRKSVV